MANGVAGRPVSEALAIARLAGDKTYFGSTHRRCNTSLRYTASGGCVQCARAKQTEMRAALLAAKQSEVEQEAFIDQVQADAVEQFAEPEPLTPPQHAIIANPWD